MSEVTQDEMYRAVGFYHDRLERSWSDETAAPGFRPLPTNMSPSYGHCKVTTCVLLGELSRDFPREALRPVSGKVAAVSKDVGEAALQWIIDGHIWIDWQRVNFDEVSVIDAAPEQADRPMPPYLVASHEELQVVGVAYQIFRTYESVEDLIERSLKREPSLRQRVQLLQDRFDQLR